MVSPYHQLHADPNPTMASTTGIAQRLRQERAARAVDAALRDTGLTSLGLPTAGEAAVGRGLATAAQRALLVRHVLGLVERAGVADAFRALLINDAIRRRDEALCDALGIPKQELEQPAGPPRVERVLPPGVPFIPDPEHTGQAVARQLTSAIATEQEFEETNDEAE